MNLEPCTSLLDTAEDCLQTSFLDTDQLSLLSGTNTPAKSCENEPQTDGFPACTCGRETLDCLTHPSTPDKWTAFMRDFLVRTLASLESRQAYLREPDQVFTAKSCASLAWYDQSSYSWKTYQQSLVTDWEQFSETWPRWGMTAGGSAYAHPMSERRITETDGSYLPTPVSSDGTSGGIIGANDTYKETKNGTLRKYNGQGTNGSLGLGRYVRFYPTPTTNDAKNATLPESQRLRDGMAGALMRDGVPAGGQLNPAFVEWLMAFPIGFTVSKDWVTRSVRCKPQPPTDCLVDFDVS